MNEGTDHLRVRNRIFLYFIYLGSCQVFSLPIVLGQPPCASEQQKRYGFSLSFLLWRGLHARFLHDGFSFVCLVTDDEEIGYLSFLYKRLTSNGLGYSLDFGEAEQSGVQHTGRGGGACTG